MDSNSYPPPPSVPTAPPEASVPQYAPPVPPESVPPNYAPQGTPPPPKKKKTLVIVLVILGVLLLCCIGSTIAGISIFKKGADSFTDALITTDDTYDTSGDDGDLFGETGERSEWTEFQPELADSSLYTLTTFEQDDLIEEITAKLYPGFTVEDTLLERGDGDSEGWNFDTIYVKASLASDPDVRIAYYFWADSPESIAAGWTLGEEDAEDYETHAVSKTGINYIYDHENLEGLIGGSIDQDIVAVLSQAEKDFPGYVAMLVGEDDDGYGAAITRWEVFPDLDTALVVTFTADGSGWAVSDVSDM